MIYVSFMNKKTSQVGDRKFTTWVGAAVIVVAAVLCMKCRQKEDSEDDVE